MREPQAFLEAVAEGLPDDVEVGRVVTNEQLQHELDKEFGSLGAK